MLKGSSHNVSPSAKEDDCEKGLWFLSLERQENSLEAIDTEKQIPY